MDSKTKISSIYKPTAKEPFMNPKQKQYFKQKLLDWKVTLLKGSTETIINLKEDKDFKFNILKDIFQDIAYFTMVNSNCACLNLKEIFKTIHV